MKFPTTFIIQPPSSSQAKSSTLLCKRYKPAELGDLLMKKIKTQTSNSESNSHQTSPLLKDNTEESTSMLEEIDSPSTKSDYEHATEKLTAQKIIDNVLIPQRSISAPLAFSNFCVRPSKLGVNESQRQVKHALDVLQKKMMIEQHAAALREILLKAKLAHEPLLIPPLISEDNLHEVPAKKTTTLKNGDDEIEVIYGDVDYPFLSLATTLNGEANQKDSAFPVVKSKLGKSKVSSNSSPGHDSKQTEGSFFDLKDFLTATRAETQRSESELGSALREMSEEYVKLAEGKKRKNKKEADASEKLKKTYKKDKELLKEKPKKKQAKKEAK